MIYKIGVHPLSHALEWKSGGANGFLSLRHFVLLIINVLIAS